MTRPFISAMEKKLLGDAKILIHRACLYKGERSTIGIKDIKRAYEGKIFGAREDRDVA